MAETYYDLLGVSEDASTEEIRAAYRDRLKETHPDVSDDDDAGDRTRRLIEAKEVLVDDEERARYDRLGHDAYVTREADPGERTDGDSTVSAEGRAGAGTDDDPNSGPASGQSGTAGHQSAAGVGDRAGSRSDWTDAGRGDGDFEYEDVTASADGRASTGTPNDQRAPRDSWADAGSGDGNTAWRAWNTDGAYTVRDDGFQRSRLFPTSQSLVVLCATFLVYPLMLWGALYPGFPLVVNGVLGTCLLLVVAYLQSIPEIGMLVFGAWTLLVPVIFAGLGLPLVSPLGLTALAGTVLPLGLSALTRAVLRP